MKKKSREFLDENSENITDSNDDDSFIAEENVNELNQIPSIKSRPSRSSKSSRSSQFSKSSNSPSIPNSPPRQPLNSLKSPKLNKLSKGYNDRSSSPKYNKNSKYIQNLKMKLVNQVGGLMIVPKTESNKHQESIYSQNSQSSLGGGKEYRQNKAGTRIEFEKDMKKHGLIEKITNIESLNNYFENEIGARKTPSPDCSRRNRSLSNTYNSSIFNSSDCADTFTLNSPQDNDNDNDKDKDTHHHSHNQHDQDSKPHNPSHNKEKDKDTAQAKHKQEKAKEKAKEKYKEKGLEKGKREEELKEENSEEGESNSQGFSFPFQRRTRSLSPPKNSTSSSKFFHSPAHNHLKPTIPTSFMIGSTDILSQISSNSYLHHNIPQNQIPNNMHLQSNTNLGVHCNQSARGIGGAGGGGGFRNEGFGERDLEMEEGFQPVLFAQIQYAGAAGAAGAVGAGAGSKGHGLAESDDFFLSDAALSTGPTDEERRGKKDHLHDPEQLDNAWMYQTLQNNHKQNDDIMFQDEHDINFIALLNGLSN
jgi:hypothetical protein